MSWPPGATNRRRELGSARGHPTYLTERGCEIFFHHHFLGHCFLAVIYNEMNYGNKNAITT
jgi:hypothetical protein